MSKRSIIDYKAAIQSTVKGNGKYGKHAQQSNQLEFGEGNLHVYQRHSMDSKARTIEAYMFVVYVCLTAFTRHISLWQLLLAPLTSAPLRPALHRTRQHQSNCDVLFLYSCRCLDFVAGRILVARTLNRLYTHICVVGNDNSLSRLCLQEPQIALYLGQSFATKHKSSPQKAPAGELLAMSPTSTLSHSLQFALTIKFHLTLNGPLYLFAEKKAFAHERTFAISQRRAQAELHVCAAEQQKANVPVHMSAVLCSSMGL